MYIPPRFWDLGGGHFPPQEKNVWGGNINDFPPKMVVKNENIPPKKFEGEEKEKIRFLYNQMLGGNNDNFPPKVSLGGKKKAPQAKFFRNFPPSLWV